jgi:hypothetical protein
MMIDTKDKIKKEHIESLIITKSKYIDLQITEINIKEVEVDKKVIKEDKPLEDKKNILMTLIKKTIKVKTIPDIK